MTDDTFESLPYAVRKGQASLRVRVTPRAARNHVGGVCRDAEGRAALVVRVTAAPEKGKANKAVIATLAKGLRLAKSRLTIKGGLSDRNKIIVIAGHPAEFESALRGLLQPDLEE
jgi:hypothetical protein